MKRALASHISRAALSSSTTDTALLSRRYAVAASTADGETETVSFPREGSEVSYGLNWALAGRGVIIKDKAFHNVKLSEVQKHSASTVENLSDLPLHVRGDALGAASKVSKAQFGKLLKLVTSHMSSISNVYVQDGAIGSSPQCDAKVRVISDNPSALLSVSKILWETPTRAISHDPCPLTVYVASSLSPSRTEVVGLGSHTSTGFAAADLEHSSLILCGKAFADAKTIKDALAALAAPVVSARGGIPLSARILVSGDSVIVLFASDDTIRKCSDLHKSFVSTDAGVIISSHGVTSFFQSGGSAVPNPLKKPASMIFASADSSGALPSISKLSPGQAAYHFLAGYQDGKFVPAYSRGPSPFLPMALSEALYLQLKETELPVFLINVIEGGKHLAGTELIKLMESTVTNSLPESEKKSAGPKGGDLRGKYKSFLSDKFQKLPEEFCF